jgi:hypothetical protein
MKMQKWLIISVTILVALSFLFSVYSLKTAEYSLRMAEEGVRITKVSQCNSLASLPKVEPPQGGVIVVDELVMCRDVLGDKFPSLLTHLIARAEGTYVVVISDHAYHVFYNGRMIDSKRNENQVTKGIWTYTKVFYTTPEMEGLKEIVLKDCDGDMGTGVPDGTLVIYPCQGK